MPSSSSSAAVAAASSKAASSSASKKDRKAAADDAAIAAMGDGVILSVAERRRIVQARSKLMEAKNKSEQAEKKARVRRVVFIIALAVLTVLAFAAFLVTFYVEDARDWDWGREPTWRWLLWGGIVLGSGLALYVVVLGVLAIIGQWLPAGASFWLDSVPSAVIVAVWAVVNWSLLSALLPGVYASATLDGSAPLSDDLLLADSLNSTALQNSPPPSSPANSSAPSPPSSAAENDAAAREGRALEDARILAGMISVFRIIFIIALLHLGKTFVSKWLSTILQKGHFERIHTSLLLERLLELLGVADPAEAAEDSLEAADADVDVDDEGSASHGPTAQGVTKAVDGILHGKSASFGASSARRLLRYRVRAAGDLPTFSEMASLNAMLDAEAERAAVQVFRSCGVAIPPEIAAAHSLDALDAGILKHKKKKGKGKGKKNQGGEPRLATALTFTRFRQALLDSVEARAQLPLEDDKREKRILRFWTAFEGLARGQPEPPSLSGSGAGAASDGVPLSRHDGFDLDLRRLSFADVSNILRTIYAGREQLYVALHDNADVVGIMNRTLSVVFWVIVFFSALIWVGVDVAALFVPLATIALAGAFVFGSSLADLWRSVLFLFVARSVSVGDRVAVGGTSGATLIFARLGLLTCEAYEPNGRLHILSTPALASASTIVHYTRSRSQGAILTLYVKAAAATPDAIAAFKQRLVDWCVQDRLENGSPWDTANCLFWVGGAKEATLEINLAMALVGINHAQPVEFLPRRHKLWLQANRIAGELGLIYANPRAEVKLIQAGDKGYDDAIVDLKDSSTADSDDSGDDSSDAAADKTTAKKATTTTKKKAPSSSGSRSKQAKKEDTDSDSDSSSSASSASSSASSSSR